MRLAFCFKVARLKGFFWAKRLFLYRSRFAGFLTPGGVGARVRHSSLALSESAWLHCALGIHTRLRGAHKYAARLRNMGIVLLRLSTPRLEGFWPSAWAAYRHLRIRTIRGRCYRLGLPARGQRTRSNAASARRFTSEAVRYLRAKLWFGKLWEPRKAARAQSQAKRRQGSKVKGGKAQTKAKVAKTRSTKKVDVWR